MDHFTKGQTIKKHSGVDDDRQGGKRRRKETDRVPQRPTRSPVVLMLLHFHIRQLFDKTIQEQLDTDWPTYKNHYYLSKHCYSQLVWILIKSCKANTLWSLAHWLHLSAMNDRSECSVKEPYKYIYVLRVNPREILSPGAWNYLFISSIQRESVMGPRWTTSGCTVAPLGELSSAPRWTPLST